MSQIAKKLCLLFKLKNSLGFYVHMIFLYLYRTIMVESICENLKEESERVLLPCYCISQNFIEGLFNDSSSFSFVKP